MHRIRDSPFVPKSAIYLDFVRYSNFYLSATTGSIQNLRRKHCTCRRVFNWKTFVWFFCISIPIVQIFQKNIQIIFIHFQTHISPKLRVLFLWSVSTSKILLIQRFFDEGFVDLCSLHQCFDSPKFPRSANSIFLSPYMLEFLHH